MLLKVGLNIWVKIMRLTSISLGNMYINFRKNHQFLFKSGLFIFWAVINIISLFLIVLLKGIKLYRKIKIYRVFAGNYGHFIFNTEIVLRRKIINNSKDIVIGIVDYTLPNKYLYKMYSRSFYIVKLPFPSILKMFYSMFIGSLLSLDSLFGKSEFFINNYIDCNSYEEFNHPYFANRFLLNFTSDELINGKKLKAKMGLNADDWYICFHNRDDKYLNEVDTVFTRSYHSFRNCSGDSFLPATDYIAKQGGFSIRMGSIIESKLNTINKKVIDYASNFRTEFGDIYLTGNCKFFLSNTSGIILSSIVRNIPIAMTNVIPLPLLPYRKGDLYIFKKLYSKKEKRYLTIREMIKIQSIDKLKKNTRILQGVEVHKFTRADHYNELGLIPVENSPEEILALTKEMNDKLDNKYVETEQGIELKKIYYDIMRLNKYSGDTPAEISVSFLKLNINLLD